MQCGAGVPSSFVPSFGHEFRDSLVERFVHTIEDPASYFNMRPHPATSILDHQFQDLLDDAQIAGTL
eukprot:6081310-Alexandrium_andersonii.AAC.1